VEAGPFGRELDANTVHRLLNAVLDAGINFIDTSPDYGLAEELIGNAPTASQDRSANSLP